MENRTVRVRIIMYLMKCRYSSGEHILPREITALGIAEALGIRKNHAGNEMKKLEHTGYVEVKSAYIVEENRVMNSYILTQAGRSFGSRLREKLGDEQCSVRADVRGSSSALTARDTVQSLSEENRQSVRAQPDSTADHGPRA